ncbi:protein Shroom3 [Electrophorus electricus]|uniref:protein Shroom3 n=1 Tax=Electrophorus electricus TaxID=8005 RepID=UPI0015D0B9F5|nr:protein Shroom3 [Electrophorus electricus]XP_026875372.2 protein Shroom3 [Electrophorus electricus]
MDSYNFQFERMSNLDLHPLSLPVSRLSPAKSTSSIDQYTHHHSKGDSAYSSFSGGSSAHDYSSPFLSDDFHPHNLQYTDLKYVKAVYSPRILESDPKSMDQLYHSMEALAQQDHHPSKNVSPHVKDPLVPDTALPTPPPPPAPLNSFVENLEISQAHQSPEGHLGDISSSRPQTANSEVLVSRSDPVCGWRFSEHYPKDQLKLDAESKSAAVLSRLTWQTSERLQHTKGSQSEVQQKRSLPAYGVPVNEQQSMVNPWHMAQNMISGSIQHKGQFYFVTGVYKSSESSVPQPQCVVDTCSTEPHRQAERQRSHSTIENMFMNVPLRKPSSPDGPKGKLFFQENKQSSAPKEYEEPAKNHVFNHFCKIDKASQGANVLEDSQKIMSMDTGRHHTTNHPIFYCGPETSFSTSDTSQNKTPETDQSIHTKEDEYINRLTRQPLVDVPSEKISKETTPLLYHLTGANQASFMNKAKNEKSDSWGCKDPDWSKTKPNAGKQSLCSSGDTTHSEICKEETVKDFSYLCNTLDDSFKKYYKEKLKDAQSKVLRETSFKRKDLQLSWPYRIEQRSDKKLSVVPSGLPQDMHSKPECPIQPHLPKFQQTEKEFMKTRSQDIDKGVEKEQNTAQPQVPRVGHRKRLTLEQKKLSRSEPEKLHQLADEPTHITCRSLGSENEGLLSEDSQGEHGLVATRRNVFETRGRALSASNLSKSTLKDLQHKALVAYMERKTGQKVVERQQPAPQVPSQRHSSGGRETDWSPRPNSANSGCRKKLLRPLSAGRILDACPVYAQFTSAQTSGQSRQSSRKEEPPPPSGKSASVEILLDETEILGSYRARSTSTPHAFSQIRRHFRSSSMHNKDISSCLFSAQHKEDDFKHHAASVPDQRPARVMASRGKSLEELGVSKVARPRVLSKSSEQLHQPQEKPVASDRESRYLPFLAETQEHTQRKLRQEHAPLIGCEKNIQAIPDQHCSKEPSSLDHPSTTGEGITSSAAVSCLPSCDDKPPVSHGKEDRLTSTASSLRGSSLGVSKMKAVPQEQSSTKLEMPPGDLSEVQRCNFGHEVCLTIGITTDPNLWGDKGDECTPSQNVTTGHLQNTRPTPCDEMETAPNLIDFDLDSVSTHDGNQEKKETGENCGSLEAKKPVGACSKGQHQWEILIQDVVSADQSLARILYPITNRKTALMLMEQLLSEDTLLMEEHYKKKQEQKVNMAEQTNGSPEMTNSDKVNNPSVPADDSVSLTAQQHTQCNTGVDITEKKRQLVAHLQEQLTSVEGLRSALQEEEQENGVRGDSTEALVRSRCLPAELERYTLFIGDLERVINLLLCLSARLARVQNTLSTVDENTDAEEKQSLANRHQLLCKQREDAKDLKDNLDRRERVVSGFLAKQLSDSQLQEYRRFVQTKASLLIRHKELDEKQRLAEEQLEALLNSISP